ncbi:MAG: hypothetical protein U1E65_31750 [Myxococcota bacterium]
MKALHAAAFAILALPGWAHAEEGPGWKVLPARAETPPPRDPSLARLSGEIREAIAELVEGDVAMVSREIRDEACPSYDGNCPRDVAALVNADKVVSLVLQPDFSSVELRVYDHRSGLTKQGKIPCKWAAGYASCEREGIQKILAPKAVEPAPVAAPSPSPSPAKEPRARHPKASKAEPSPSPVASASPTPPAIEDPVIARAAKALRKKFQKCTKQGWGETPVGDRPKDMEIQFRMGADGKAREVRVGPPGFDDVPAFACMARILESLKVAPESAKEGVYRLPLPRP